MATISVTNINDGDAVTAASINNQVNTIVNDYNGNITDANVSASAAIGAQKLAGGVSGMFGAWTSYTPTFTNFTIGNAVMTAKYVQVGKTVIARGTVTLGTTSSMGTQPTMTLPVTASSDYGTHSVLGIGDTLRTGVSDFQLAAIWATTTTATLFCWNAAGANLTLANITSTVPGTWASTDVFTWKIEYEAA